jgi:hypothetical protein
MPEGNFRKVCITLRGDQVNDLKARSRNVSRIIRDAIDYYLTLDIGSSDIAVYEIRRDVKTILAAVTKGKKAVKVPQPQPPSKEAVKDLGPLASIVRNEKDEQVIRLMLSKGHENTKTLVDELGYSRTESIRDKLNSLNARSEEEFGRPLFRYFRSRDGIDYSWWLMAEMDELKTAKRSKKAPRENKTPKTH